MRQPHFSPHRLMRLVLVGAVSLGLFLLLSLNMRTRSRSSVLGFGLPKSNGTWGGWSGLLGAKDTADQAAIRAWEIARATQHTGTGARVHRFLEKAKRGEPYTVAAIGGSGELSKSLLKSSTLTLQTIQADASLKGPRTSQPHRRGPRPAPTPPPGRSRDGRVDPLLPGEPARSSL